MERRYNLAFAVSGERLCSTIVYLKMRKALSYTGITMTRLFGRASSLMCTRKADGKICKSQYEREIGFFPIVPNTCSY